MFRGKQGQQSFFVSQRSHQDLIELAKQPTLIPLGTAQLKTRYPAAEWLRAASGGLPEQQADAIYAIPDDRNPAARLRQLLFEIKTVGRAA